MSLSIRSIGNTGEHDQTDRLSDRGDDQGGIRAFNVEGLCVTETELYGPGPAAFGLVGLARLL